MATTTSSGTSGLGNQGARGRKALYTTGRSRPISPAFAAMFDRQRGEPSSIYVPRIGAAISAAALGESDAAATPTTLPTVGSATITLAGYRASMGVTSEGRYRTLEENDPVNIEEEELMYAMEMYLTEDASVGMTYQYTQVTAVEGNSGAKLTRAGILRCAQTVWAAMNTDDLHLVAIIDGKGRADLRIEAATSASAALANEAMSEEVRSLLLANNFNPSRYNYLLSLDGRVHVFVETKQSTLRTASSDKVGCVFAPALPGLNGIGSSEQNRIIVPAFGIGNTPDPVSAARRTMLNPRDRDTNVGKIVIADRAYTGVPDLVQDAYGNGGTAILNQSAACRLLYSATA